MFRRHYLQEADTKMFLQHTAIEAVTISIHMLWYQQHTSQGLVKIIHTNVI